jgi:hypothetical protein
MIKALLLVVAGLGAGFAVASWMQSESPHAAAVGASVPTAAAAVGNGNDTRLAALEKALTTEVERRTALEARVAALTDQLAALRPPASAASGRREATPQGTADAGPPPFGRNAPWRRNQPGAEVDLLVAAGFPPDRAAWIDHRASELRMQALQAQYAAQREGRPPDPGQAFSLDNTLRAELGDGDYERYLKAIGRPTSVPVQNVLASSPAEHAGLRTGDEIVAYDGKRVFDMRDLNALTLDGTAGESVTVGVRRDGQTVNLVMPRGPIGIVGGGFRGR